MSWKVRRIGIRGLKGVLDRAGDFEFEKKKSIAVYAPNGCGKSGYADAIEYLFSQDGAVEHLGKGDADSEHGGKHALAHVLAEEKGITPEVSIHVHNVQSGDSVDVVRVFTAGRDDALPTALVPVLDGAPAHRILRQHDLRRFVVDMGPREKYSELSRWLGQEHLEEVLMHLTTTEQALAKQNPDREIKERLQDIVKQTGGAVSRHDENEVLLWCVIQASRHLGVTVSLVSLGDVDGCVKKLREHRDELVVESGKVAETYKMKTNAADIAREVSSPSGFVAKCSSYCLAATEAEDEVEQLRETTKESVFQDVWRAASGLLEARDIAECPVCLTPWDRATLGSQGSALANVRLNLANLANLSQAQSRHASSITSFQGSLQDLMLRMEQLETATRGLGFIDSADLYLLLATDLRGVVSRGGKMEVVRAEYEALFKKVSKVSADLLVRLSALTIEGVPDAAREIDETILRMHTLKETLIRLAVLERESNEYRRVEESFRAVAGQIQARASALMNDVIAALRVSVEDIYLKIHPKGGVPTIRMIPDTKSKTLVVRVGFHSVDRTVPPAGYLSEAQINSLGLALFLSSAKLFNSDFPFIVLDDICSSYDADNRFRIVNVIAEDLGDFQVFLTTHDHLFYKMLQSRLESQGWQFERITGWTFDEGPRRESDTLETGYVSSLVAEGDPRVAGNAVRQYTERWLDKMCADYIARTVHKRPPHNFDYTLFELWEPFIERLKKIKDGFFKQRVETEACYKRIVGHRLLNYYSHGRSDPYEWESMGDVEGFWEELCAFQDLFRCCSCNRPLRYQRDEERLFCTCGKQVFKSLA